MAMILLKMDKGKRGQANILPAEKGYLETPDGAKLYFEDSGGRGPVLFYLYGLGCSMRHWKYPLQYFSTPPHLYRQVWFDVRGHGLSKLANLDERLSLETILNDVRFVCESRGISRCHFLGQSLGGTIAILLAHRTPALAASIIALASPGKDPSAALPGGALGALVFRSLISLNQRSRLGVRLVYKPLQYLRPLMAEIIRHTGFNAQLASGSDVYEYVDKLLESSPNLFYDLAKELTELDLSPVARSVKCPVLIIAGAQDKVIPLSHTRWLAKQLPHTELEVLKHGSHCPHLDDPGFVNRRIEKFLRLHSQ